MNIFDQPTTSIIPVEKLSSEKAVNIGGLRAGLQYSYYEGSWKALPDFSAMVPARQGYLNSIEDSVAQNKAKSYGFKFKGYIKVPETGIYVFKLRTCDGSRLTIDGKIVADNDGIHTTVTHLSSACLDEGLHSFSLDYFRAEYGVGLRDKLCLEWCGPGFDYREVGPSDLACRESDSMPVISLVPSIENGNRLSVKQAHQLKGHKFNSLELFAGKLMLGVVDRSDAVPAFVLPAGKQMLWGRLWYDGNFSVDSVEKELLSEDSRSDSWEYSVPGEQDLPLAVSSTEDSVAVTGDGSFFAFRKVKGDFTITAKIEEIARSSDANGIAGNSLLGVLATADPQNLLSQGISFGLWDTAGIGIRSTACDRDLETSAQSRHALDHNKPWIRISKKGRLWTGYTSADGKGWERVAERILRDIHPEYNVGVIFCTRPPGNNKTLFSGRLGSVSIEQTAFDGPVLSPKKLNWRVNEDSFHGGSTGDQALDEDENTMWHTSYGADTPGYPHWLTIEFPKTTTLTGFRYLPRQSGGVNGTVKDYAVFVSDDGVEWGSPVKTGTFIYGNDYKDEQIITLDKAVRGRFVRFLCKSEVNGGPWASAAEFRPFISDTFDSADGDKQDKKQSIKLRTGRFTGIITVPADKNTLIARTYGKGLLKSTDGGRTWSALNSGLSLEAFSYVRSAALSPSDSSVILRGGGYAVRGGESVSGLWRSSDFGNNWELVCRDIDFYGNSKDVLYGETLSFNPHNSRQVAAGGRSSGLYLSNDAGQTWEYAGLKGEHISVVAFSPFNKDLLIVGTSSAGTFPGRIYYSTNGGRDLNNFVEKQDWAILNVAFESMPEGEQYLYFATDTGVYYCYSLGAYLHQYRAVVDADASYTALTGWKAGDGRNRVLTVPYGGDALYFGRIGYYWHIEWQRFQQRGQNRPVFINSMTSSGENGETVYATAENGLFVSRDHGKTFKLLHDAR